MRKLILYISMSVDGYIAGPDDDLSWLSAVEQEGEDYGYVAFNETVDTYIVGRKTHDVVVNLTGGVFPPAEKHRCFVITRQQRESAGNVEFYNGNLEDLVLSLKAESGKNIYCDGGAEIVNYLTNRALIDEYIISVIPVILGGGKKLFEGETQRMGLTTKSVKQFKSGLVQLHYVKGIEN